VTTQYDEAGRVKDRVDSFGAEQSFSYDNDGNVVSQTAAAGPLNSNANYTTAYTYNAADELTTLTDPAGRQYSFYYCKCGKPKAVQYPNGTFSWIDYNPDGWTTAVYNRHGSLSAPLSGSVPADSQGSPIADYAYTYNLDDTLAEEVRSGGGLTTETTDYQYDALGRLSQVTLPDGTNRTYTYDLDSNRTRIVENGTTVASYGYDPSVTPGIDQLTSVIAGSTTTAYGYDTDGDTTSRGADTIRWDGRGRHTGGTFNGTTITYGFDATGFRRQRTAGASTTRYLLNGLFETDGGGSITSTSLAGTDERDLTRFAGPPTTSTTVTYSYYNAHGDLAAEAGQNGTRTAAFTYDPFGALRTGPAPANATAERWVGAWNKKLDTTSSLIEMGARTYDPLLGRFLSVDPVDGGSCNLYDYACQEPLNSYDLDGNLFGWAKKAWHAATRTVAQDIAFWRRRATDFVKGLRAIGDAARAWANEHARLINDFLRTGSCEAARELARTLAADATAAAVTAARAGHPEVAAELVLDAVGFLAGAETLCYIREHQP
jgi:RHS repeat-associated protein